MYISNKNVIKAAAMLGVVLLLGGCSKKSEQVVFTDISSSEELTSDNSAVSEGSTTANLTEENSDSSNVAETVEETRPQNVIVHVCGAVKLSGVYELPQDSRVIDAVNAAGGFSQDADMSFINQASIITDGMKIQIPTIEETSIDESAPKELSESLFLTTDEASSPNEEKSKLVNINTADADELCSIPGIGNSRAESIIQYRQEHGNFSKIEDIMQVSGIKDKFFEKIKEHITV
ncbi:MAG: ComEA family DNA-binding protein [Butyrivibrio sp.]|nr:ComEA family DNA-binding protein [Butyrivibrio sp.]